MSTERDKSKRRSAFHLPPSYSNIISHAGTVIAVVSLFMFVFLYAQTSISKSERPYEGVVIFMFIPAFLIFGLILIPLGMIRKHRRLRAARPPGPEFPVLDLNKRYVRNATAIFAAGSILLLFVSALGTYNAYHFTESVTFCGELCHKVMNPEYTTYQTSPHARVPCASCHVGPGASWYVKSKLTGIYQVYATLANVYPRPIPAPIKHLRPARETCEQCHWPQKVYGKQQTLRIHYLPDESNTRWNIEMLLNTGAGNPAFGQKTGIHWHINPDIDVQYVATDAKRQTIPRVILVNRRSGEKTVFTSTEEKPGAPDIAGIPVRVIDCIDCHNQPSHFYQTPSAFINVALTEGRIDLRLPFVKQATVEACLPEYKTAAEAAAGIRTHIRGFYTAKFADVAGERVAEIEKSIAGTLDAYSHNIFPEMKVSWEVYADNIGHMTTPGCFRCHDGQHATPEGKVISKDCGLCHIIYAQGKEGEMAFFKNNRSLEFRHPVDIGEAWKEGTCTDCHSSSTI
jgi:nitrate/TMAO reductase-like tetraheme cytochrome c subunit